LIAEIICVGTELLLGETINTNAAFISGKLAEIGIDCYYQSTVGDNPTRIKSVFDTALKRADIIIFTGGLGATDDDITVQSIAEHLNEELVLDENSLNRIKDFFDKIQTPFTECNKKQALRPKRAVHINNPVGTAPGIIWEIPWYERKKVILAFPGVPDELHLMWEESAKKYLSQFSHSVLVTRYLKFIGISEVNLGNKVKDLMTRQNPTVAPLVNRWEPTIRIAAKSSKVEDANVLVDAVEKEIMIRVGEYFYGYGDETLEYIVGKLLIDRGLTVSLAESCTGGLISSRLTDISGSSNYIKLNFVTYSNESKIKNLGVHDKIIQNYGAVSKQTALSMAECTRALANTDIGVGVTGIAGPTGGTPEKPVGLVYIGICDKHFLEAHEIRIPSTLAREEIKYLASQHALNYLRLFIAKHM